jgi:hypothetical protein
VCVNYYGCSGAQAHPIEKGTMQNYAFLSQETSAVFSHQNFQVTTDI